MLNRRRFLTASAVLPAASLMALPAFAGKSPVFATGGIAINGYDPVAYFRVGAPVKGMEAYSSDWEGARLLFSSAENKAMFDADPEAFAPKYGGYCAYAVSKGATAPTDPEAWTVYEDQALSELLDRCAQHLAAGHSRQYRKSGCELARCSGRLGSGPTNPAPMVQD